MRKIKNVQVPYTDNKGNEGVLNLEIVKVVNSIIRDYNSVKSYTEKVQGLLHSLNDLKTEIAATAARALDDDGKLKNENFSNVKDRSKIEKLVSKQLDKNLKLINKTDWSDNKEIKELNDKIANITTEMEELGNVDFFQKRYDLIEKILIKNGYAKENFCTFDFWDENVDPLDITLFLDDVIYKDFEDESKKKAM